MRWRCHTFDEDGMLQRRLELARWDGMEMEMTRRRCQITDLIKQQISLTEKQTDNINSKINWGSYMPSYMLLVVWRFVC